MLANILNGDDFFTAIYDRAPGHGANETILGDFVFHGSILLIVLLSWHPRNDTRRF